MNTIEFEIIKTENNIFDVDVVIDNQRMKGLLDLPSVLNLARLELCRFDLFTCSCGIAGCAGYHETVVMKKTHDGIVRMEIPDYYPVYGIFYFDQKDFDYKLGLLGAMAYGLESKNVYHNSLLTPGYEEPSQYLDLRATVDKYHKYYLEQQRTNTDWNVYYKDTENDERED